ncbi:NB-ARC domain-containing protein [Embleya sp. NBC_00896]|uniref:NB-ARC domain-containing protein n=1 Tax=Embleya sp. NBC_00896 TaxID=2975961 RepID=UPI00386C33D2|nr:NB-ARC domain-containing protein [Embleya sp. NBC_00896]
MSQAPARPQQLPVASAWWVDREDPLAVLDSLLGPAATVGRPAVAVLSGVAGVGKRAVGRHWSHGVAADFVDGVLYADLGRLRRDGAVDVGEVLGGFLRALGTADPWMPVSTDERAALFRSLTAGRKLLVLLDDVDQPRVLETLLPASERCVVVATSRWRLDELGLDDVLLLAVEPLAEADGVRLLAEMIGTERVAAEPAAAVELARYCGGLPVALRVVGARLKCRPGLTLGALAAELADPGGRLAHLERGGQRTVAAVWDSTYEGLSADAALVYRLAALLPGPDFTVPAVAAATGLTVDQAAAAVQELRVAHLVTEDVYERFGFHELVRLHARGYCGEDEGKAALDRAVRWYLRAAAVADRAVLGVRRMRAVEHPSPNPEVAFATPAEGIAWLDAEHANLVAWVAEAERRGWDARVWQLCEPLWALYTSRPHYRDWLDTHERAIAVARRLGDAWVEVRMRSQISRAQVELERRADAVATMREALVIAGGIADDRLSASAWEFLGKAESGPAAERAFEESLRINASIPNPRGMALQHHHLGQVVADPDAALAHLAKARELAVEVDDERIGARVSVSLGRRLGALGRTEEAAAVLRTAVETFRRRQAPVDEAGAVERLAEVMRAAGDGAGAAALYRTAADLHEVYGGPKAAELRGLAAEAEQG